MITPEDQSGFPVFMRDDKWSSFSFRVPNKECLLTCHRCMLYLWPVFTESLWRCHSVSKYSERLVLPNDLQGCVWSLFYLILSLAVSLVLYKTRHWTQPKLHASWSMLLTRKIHFISFPKSFRCIWAVNKTLQDAVYWAQRESMLISEVCGWDAVRRYYASLKRKMTCGQNCPLGISTG